MSKQFEDSIAWQKAKILTIAVYRILESLKDHSFKNQLQRAAISIMNNVAEGFERQTQKEMKQFLYIAKGSAGEARSMIAFGMSLNYFSKNEGEKLYEQATKIAKILSGFIKKL